MKIEFTYDKVEGEPGPNLYFTGSQKDFKILIELMRKLTEIDSKIIISDFFRVSPSDTKISFQSISNGDILSSIKKNQISSVLNRKNWGEILENAESIVNQKGHIYIEFDQLELKEECNIIWSSEFQ